MNNNQIIPPEQIKEALKNRYAKLERIQMQCLFHHGNEVDPDFWMFHTGNPKEDWLQDLVDLLGNRTHHTVKFLTGARIWLQATLPAYPLANVDWLMIEMIKSFTPEEDDKDLRRWLKDNGGHGWLPTDRDLELSTRKFLQVGQLNHYMWVIGILLDDLYPNNEIRCEPPY